MPDKNQELHCENARMMQGKTLTTAGADSLATIFKALSDPTRLKILSCLLMGELCVHDISLLLELSQPTVSNQLRLLKQFHLVKVRKDGKRAFYSLDDEHVEQLYRIGLSHCNHTY